MEQNVQIIFNEKKALDDTGEVSYSDLVKEVDMMEMTADVFDDDIIALEVEYNTNYTKKELEKIIDYYKLEKRNKRKIDIIESIIFFEKNVKNIERVHRRKKLWSYMEEIKEDDHLRKYLIFD
tara:strand:- start:1922 stop:2290 length:369 start_codon:yes stop_codon:yes gene_type:complete